jgi:hypothetical protein
MLLARRSLLFSVLAALMFIAPSSWARDISRQWDGTWKGKIGPFVFSDVAVKIADGKVVSYTLRGAPFVIKFSKVSHNAVSFGDGENYYFRMKKADGATTAIGTLRGRIGAGRATLSKESA